jgi:hypothetical protein
MNNPEADNSNNTSADSQELASNKAIHPSLSTGQPNQAIITDYCQNLEDLLN